MINAITYDVDKNAEGKDRLKAYAEELSKKYSVKAKDNGEGGKDK